MNTYERNNVYFDLFMDGTTKQVEVIVSGGLRYILTGSFLLDTLGRPIGFVEEDKSFWPWSQILNIKLIRKVP